MLAAIMTGLAVMLAAWHALAPGPLTEAHLWQIGFSSIFLLVVYVIGMRIVYGHRPASQRKVKKIRGFRLSVPGSCSASFPWE